MPANYQATIVIHSHLRRQFGETMQEFIPLLASFGFKMLKAFSKGADRIGAFVHIWEIEDANMLMSGIRKWR